MEASHQGDGVWRIDRVAGSTEAPTTPPTTGGGGMEPEDASPRFASGSGPGDQAYTVGTAIALTLPAASGGDGTLTYSLAPSVAGLTFNAGTRQLTGTPSTAGTHAMTYTVTDEDGDTDTLIFTVTVEESDDGGDGDGNWTWTASFDWQVDDGNGVPAGMAYVNGRFYVVDRADNKVYAYTESGQRDAAADFDLDPNIGSSTDIVYANARFYVPDRSDNKAHAYTASGERDATADFDLHAGNGELRAITYANGRFYVVDRSGGNDRKVYAYTDSGERDTAADFDLGDFSHNLHWIAHANGRFYVVNEGNRQVYAYTDSGERDVVADFGLPGDNQNPWDIAYANGRFYVLDTVDDKVYAYTKSGQRDTVAEFDMHEDNNNPGLITYANGRFYVVSGYTKQVYAYTDSGERDATADFDLHADIGFPYAGTYANGRLYVVDEDDDKVHAYTDSGERDAAAEFDLHADIFYPTGMTYANGRFYVVDALDKVYAYTDSGERDAAADFQLRRNNFSPIGITYADGRFYVLDYSLNTVFAYSGPVERDGNETSYGVGDAITTLPTGVWFPDVTSGASFIFSGGNAVINLNNGGYIEEEGYRYTCQNTGGCEISNRQVVSGTIVQTSTTAMPEDTRPSFAGASGPDNQSYTVGTAIATLTLPAASGGNGALSYSLSPDVPGLSFNATTRQLTGTPTTVGTYAMTYTVMDDDDDVDSLSFTIIAEARAGISTRYVVGDAITTLPTGTWFPDLIRGSVSFRISGGSAAIDFGNGGYIEEGSNRYTCASAGGCQVRGREVRAGAIVQTPSGVAPEEIPPTSDTAGTCDVALGRSAGAGGTETVSVALVDALETDVGTLANRVVASARMDDASDFDVYKIVLSDAGTLVVLSGGALDTQAVFLRSDCTEEAHRVANDAGQVAGFEQRGLNFAVAGHLGAGTYYVVVYERASRTGNYTLEFGFASAEVGNDTPVIEPVAHQEVAPGDSATVDVEVTDDTGDAHAIVATSDNEDVATVDLTGSGSTRSLAMTAKAAGTATVTLRAVDQEDAVASPVTFDVIVASPTLAAPELEPGSNSGDLEVTVVTTFGPRETRAHDYQIRVKRPQTPWHTVGCHAITNNSDGTAAGPFSVTLGNNPAGLTYDVRYRYRNSSSCNAGLPGPWSAVGEGISGGTAANATPAFPEGASTDRSVNENVGGGINVGSPVAASDADGVRDVLTYSLGGADAGSFQIVAATGQIRTRDGITYDHEARDTYSVTVEARDVHSETDRISVDIHIVDLGAVCASPPRLRLNSGDGGLTVRWPPLADRAGNASVLGYEVERRDGTGGAWGNRQIIGGRATSNVTYTGLVNGRQYDVRIRPFGNEDACEWSAPVSGIPTTDTAPQDQPDFEDRVPPEKQLRDWRFPVPGRFSEMREGRQFDGSYRYARTDANRGTITLEYDEIGRSGCEISLLFSSLTSGSFLDECEGAGVNVDVNFDIEEPPAPSSPLAPQTMEAFDGLALGNDNLVPGFHFGEYYRGFGGGVSGVVSSYRGVRDSVREDFRLGTYTYESTGADSGALTVRFGCRCPRDEWGDNDGSNRFPDEEWVFELSFLSSDAAEYTVTIYREGQPPLTLNGFIDFKSGDNLSSFPPELLPPGSPPQASGNDLFGVDAATGSTSLSIGADSIQTILVQDGGIQDIAYQPGDWLEPKDGGNQRMMIVGAGQTPAPVAAGLVFRAGTPAQARTVSLASGQTDLIALSVVCMQVEKGIPKRGSRFFSQPKSPDGTVQMCQRNCVVAGGDAIQGCVWECEVGAAATSVVDDVGDSAMRQLLDALGGSSASEPIRTGARTRGDDLKSALPRID